MSPIRVLAWWVILGYLVCCTSAQDEESLSYSGSQSVGIEHKNPCSFRGGFLTHKETVRLDPCTVCTCNNHTTTCNIESCHPEPGCPASEIVIIPEECCPQCPYKMFVKNVNYVYEETFAFSEGASKKIKFGLDVEVDKRLTSRIIHGTNLWKLSAWISRNGNGSGPKYSHNENVFSERNAAHRYFKPVYPPWKWSKLRYTANFGGGSCDDYKYLCVKFDEADNPQPKYDLSFTFQPVNNEVERLIDCVPVGGCTNVLAKSFDWELTSEEPIPGKETAVSVNINVTFTHDTRNISGDHLWRVSLFGSGNPTGDGPRFREVVQILNDNEASTGISNGDPLEVRGIETEFEIRTVGCIEDVNYICMEFLKGDVPNPDFTFIAGGNRDSLVTCKQHECQSNRPTTPALTTVEYKATSAAVVTEKPNSSPLVPSTTLEAMIPPNPGQSHVIIIVLIVAVVILVLGIIVVAAIIFRTSRRYKEDRLSIVQ